VLDTPRDCPSFGRSASSGRRRRRPRFRLGEQVLVTHDGKFLPAEIIQLPGRAPYMRWLRVRFADGREADEAVSSCHRDGPEFRAWRDNLRAKESLAAQLIEICKREGFTFGGPACARLPEWAEYQRQQRQLSVTGGAAFAVHPYGY
jgi:hypothetical protein